MNDSRFLLCIPACLGFADPARALKLLILLLDCETGRPDLREGMLGRGLEVEGRGGSEISVCREIEEEVGTLVDRERPVIRL